MDIWPWTHLLNMELKLVALLIQFGMRNNIFMIFFCDSRKNLIFTVWHCQESRRVYILIVSPKAKTFLVSHKDLFVSVWELKINYLKTSNICPIGCHKSWGKFFELYMYLKIKENNMFWFLCFSEWDLKTLFYGHNGVFMLEHHFGEYFVHTQGNPQRIWPPSQIRIHCVTNAKQTCTKFTTQIMFLMFFEFLNYTFTVGDPGL